MRSGKNSFFFFVVLLFTSCGMGRPELPAAKNKAEELLQYIQAHAYDKTSSCYSASFNESENVSKRQEKFEQIEKVSGAVRSINFMESREEIIDERPVLVLTYKVQHEKTTLTHVLIIGMEEGICEVLQHAISN